ncbi:MAG: acyl-CoA dehydrogenase family protein, partial [Nocardioides sp.]
MPIGVSDEHRDLATSMRGWAEGLGGPALARAAEGQAAEVFDAVWGKVVDQGVVGICVPEALGGGGGSVLDAAVALEACAATLVPGALLGTTVVGALLARHGSALPDSARAGFALGPDVAYDAV